jgi:hypothetical protein
MLVSIVLGTGAQLEHPRNLVGLFGCNHLVRIYVTETNITT